MPTRLIPLFLLLVTLTAPLARAQQAGDFTYSSNASAITITSYTGAGGAVSIPETIAGLPVRTIGDSAFYHETALTSVTIPNSVTSIELYAFSGCTGLTSVTIPDSVTSIGFVAFSGCTGLTSATIGNSVTSMESYAFARCTGLTSVTILNGVTSIGDSAFRYCTSLTSVIIPNSVTSIEDGAFSDCRNLANVTIGNSVTSMGRYAFSGCMGLTSVIIPNSVTSIGDGAFSGCWGLASVTIGNSVTSIGDFAFNECTSLTSATIGNSVTSIGWYAFRYCTSLTSLTSVTIPNSVISIGDGPFVNCTDLLNIEVAAGSTAYCSVDGSLFSLSQTTLIQYPGGKTGSYTIPNGVTSIGTEAFARCTGLTSVTIPNSVTSIRDGSFVNCTGLTGATFEGNAPASFGMDVFRNTAADFTIYYHEESTGFTSPTWQEYPAVMLSTQPTLEEWREQHFGEGATNSGDAADEADPDGDGFTNIEEYAAGTDPTRAGSQWQVASATRTETTYTVTFDAQPGRRYDLRLVPATPDAAWQTVVTQQPLATAGLVSLTDPAAPAEAALYRVRVTLP